MKNKNGSIDVKTPRMFFKMLIFDSSLSELFKKKYKAGHAIRDVKIRFKKKEKLIKIIHLVMSYRKKCSSIGLTLRVKTLEIRLMCLYFFVSEFRHPEPSK